MSKKYFINLTNGLEFLDKYSDIDWHFVRIQSTALEQKRYNFIIEDLDYDFLLNIALGYEVFIADCSKKVEPRAFWQGIAWIKYVLNRRWFNINDTVYIKNNINVSKYFDEQYRNLSKRAKTKLNYFKKFLNIELFNNGVIINTLAEKTENDGNYKYFNKILVKYFSNVVKVK